MAWVNYCKAYDSVPHSRILECLNMFGIAEKVKVFLKASVVNWRVDLTACGEDLGSVDTKRGVFQGDTVCSLLFVLCMITLSCILRKENAGYELKGKKCKINHLLFMDDLKLYGKSQDQIDSLIRTVRF